MKQVFWRIVFFVVGFLACMAFQHVLEWRRLNASPLASHAVPPEIRDDFAATLHLFSKKRALTEQQLAWLVFQYGFSGFSTPAMAKGAVVVGRNYFSTSRGNDNIVTFGSEAIRTGSRDANQLLVIDPGQQKVMASVGLPAAASIRDLEFLVFTPSDIRQFSMNTVFGVRTVRVN